MGDAADTVGNADAGENAGVTTGLSAFGSADGEEDVRSFGGERAAEGPDMAVGALDFDCGIGYGRIEAWLCTELDLPLKGDLWTFPSHEMTCRIWLERLEPRVLGSVEIERTHLVASGDKRAVEEFERLFTLRFMSAGG